MPKANTEQAQAAYTLSDEIMDMRMALDRAEIIMQDLTEEYFNKYDSHSEDGRTSIAWEYERYTLKSEIVSEYLYKIRAILDSLSSLGRKGSELKHRIAGDVA